VLHRRAGADLENACFAGFQAALDQGHDTIVGDGCGRLASARGTAEAAHRLEIARRYLREAADLTARYRLRGQWLSFTGDLTSVVLLANSGEVAEAEAATLDELERARRQQARLETTATLLSLARIGSRAGAHNRRPRGSAKPPISPAGTRTRTS
jgi:hypothetical protein